MRIRLHRRALYVAVPLSLVIALFFRIWQYSQVTSAVDAIYKLNGAVDVYLFLQLGPQEVTFDILGRPILLDDESAPEIIRELKKLPRLSELHLSRTRVSDRTLSQLRQFPQLWVLHLQETNITDAGVKYLVDLKNLEYLDLQETNITDAGVKYLADLKELVYLNVSETSLSDESIDALQDQLPFTVIHHCR